MRLSAVYWLLLVSVAVRAQTNNPTVADSSGTLDRRVFAFSDMADLITASHPLVRLANTLPDEARQELLQARGFFDPKLTSGYGRKQFGDPAQPGSLYYNNWSNELKVPVWYGGADLKVTYDRFTGARVNPEDRTPSVGLLGVGVSLPIGQGLLIDARRTAIRQAQLLPSLANAEQVKQINKVWLSAAKDYWNWYLAQQQVSFLNEGIQLADTRFRAVKQRVELGDAAAIDSVEARIIVQDRQVQLERALVNLQNTRLIVSTYLWNDAGQPVDLPELAIPQRALPGLVDEALFQLLSQRAAENHPELVSLDLKIRQQRLEEQFRRSLLQPQMSVSGQLLSQASMPTVKDRELYGFGFNNYKIGVDFALPLFLRKERGKLRQVQIKTQQLTFDRTQTSRDVQNNVSTAYNEIRAIERQEVVQADAVRNQQRLLRAEQQRFELGESSLFLVNTRETKLIDMQLKLEELRSKYQKAVAELYYAAGGRN
ncbi:MAG: TolC family protein [Cytophagales bacterium]|nr:MAG: TolC family protein [Cytophagales bacterium]